MPKASLGVQVLGINSNNAISDADMKLAFKALALEVHPDKSAMPGADKAWLLLQQAADALQTATRRVE